MSYTYADFYSKKTNRELFSIYTKGTIAEKKKAFEVLEGRGFDFENVQNYKEEWELERLIIEYNTVWKNPLSESLGGFDVLSVFPMLLILVIIYLIGDIIYQLTGNKESDLINSAIMLVIVVGIEFLLIWLFKKRKKKREMMIERISYLKNKVKK